MDDILLDPKLDSKVLRIIGGIVWLKDLHGVELFQKQARTPSQPSNFPPDK
jgi:hypothetical protein